MYLKALVAAVVVLTVLSACSKEKEEIIETAPAVADIDTILDDYFEEATQLSPNGALFRGDFRFNHIWVNGLTDESIKKEHQLNEKYIKLIEAIDKTHLSADDQVSYDIFLWDLKLNQSAEKFPWELLPINQFGGTPAFFARLGSGQSAQPFKTVKDYENFLQRMNGFLQWMTSAERRMQQGIEKGVVQPRSLMTKVADQLQSMVKDDVTESIFWGPIKNIPATFSDEDKQRLTDAYTKAIKERLNPAYQKLQVFVSKTYIPASRESSGLSGLPAGADWYRWQIQRHTTTNLSAEEIHNIGLEEVARIHHEMTQIKQQVEFQGDLQEFFKHLQTDEQFYFKNNEEVFERYKLERKIVEEVIPKFFDVTPKTAFEIRPVEEFRAQSAAGASYTPGSPDGSRPGIFYVNTFNLKAQPIFGVETLYLHEAIPGHHFQISLAQEQQGLADYRKFNDYTAFSEGWALYVESIGKEMGLFTDPYQYYGRLSDELLRAMRLVMDTGLHSKGWSREKAITYMLENSSMAETDVVAEVERYMAIPGQAVSYKIGQLRITAIRQWAEKELGEKFDIREFHNQVLLSGALPMSVLDEKIKRWVRTIK